MKTRSSRSLSVALMLESDGPGGAEKMILHLAEELRRRHYSVVPVGPCNGCGWLAGEFRRAGFDPEFFLHYRAIDWNCLRGLLELIRRRHVDVVHSHEFVMAVYGAAAARLCRRRHIITMHGSRYFAERWQRRLALRWAFGVSHAVGAVSDDTRSALSESLRLPRRSICVIPNGIRFQPGKRDPVRRELRLVDKEILIVAVGSLYPVKDHMNLLRAMALIDQRRELPWRVAIAGHGEEEAKLRSFAEERGLSDRVHLLGHRDDIPNVLAAGDLFVMPSQSEGLPLAVIEAMFAGMAIVATTVGGIPEILSSGENSILVPPGDHVALAEAVAQVLADSERRRTLGEAARQRAESEYSVERMADAYERLYR